MDYSSNLRKAYDIGNLMYVQETRRVLISSRRPLPAMELDDLSKGMRIMKRCRLIRNYLLSNIYLKIMEHFVCPYCGSTFKTAELLSKHIDRVHLGSGLLEGDVRKY